jgi:hypothetical protein
VSTESLRDDSESQPRIAELVRCHAYFNSSRHCDCGFSHAWFYSEQSSVLYLSSFRTYRSTVGFDCDNSQLFQLRNPFLVLDPELEKAVVSTHRFSGISGVSQRFYFTRAEHLGLSQVGGNKLDTKIPSDLWASTPCPESVGLFLS